MVARVPHHFAQMLVERTRAENNHMVLLDKKINLNEEPGLYSVLAQLLSSCREDTLQ